MKTESVALAAALKELEDVEKLKGSLTLQSYKKRKAIALHKKERAEEAAGFLLGSEVDHSKESF